MEFDFELIRIREVQNFLEATDASAPAWQPTCAQLHSIGWQPADGEGLDENRPGNDWVQNGSCQDLV